MIELSGHDWRVVVDPDVGGCIRSATWRGQDILRRMPAGSTDVLEAACFPLVPYANRIADGRFIWRGREVQLPVLPNFAPHALHGDGWRAPWRGGQAGDHAAVLSYDHPAGAWPWAYAAEQIISLGDDGLSVGLSLTNRSDQPMPAGVGLHPYFAAPPGTRMTLDAPQVWGLAEGMIPTALHPAEEVFSWAAGPRVEDAPFVDHCYVDWGGRAVIRQPSVTTTLTAQGSRWAHVYAPGEGFVCIEPVTHRPDAVHAPAGEDSGLVVLAPGESVSVSMRIGCGWL